MVKHSLFVLLFSLSLSLSCHSTGTYPTSEIIPSVKLYSRLEHLQLTKDGFLISPNGERVQGYMTDENGKLSSILTPIKIDTNSVSLRPTDTVFLNAQLDKRVKSLESEFNQANPQQTSNLNSLFAIFDSLGRSHQSYVFFKKIGAHVNGASDWEYHIMVDNKEVMDPSENQKYKQIIKGKIFFDNNGFLANQTLDESNVSFNGGAKANQYINMTFGKSLKEKGNGANASTCISANSTIVYYEQNGYQYGQIQSLDIDHDGMVQGIYTNGVEKTLGAIEIKSGLHPALG